LGLGNVVTAIRDFVMPVVDAVRQREKLTDVWKPGGPWTNKK